MCRLTQDRTQAALSAVAAFASVAGKVQHEELRAASEQVALEGLTLCEGFGQRCVGFLLVALRGSSTRGRGPEAAQDAVWMLYKVVRQSAAARLWILDADGIALLEAALVAHPGEHRLHRDGAWLAYALDGLRGLQALLRRASGPTEGEMAVRSAVVGSLYQLVKGECIESGMQPRPESAIVLEVLVQALNLESASADSRWASCAALDALVTKDPRLGSALLDGGGSALLVRLIKSARSLGKEGEDFRTALAYLLASLASCSVRAAEALRMEGVLRALVEEGLSPGCCEEGRDVEAVMWALGVLGGFNVVLEVMIKIGPTTPAVLRGGVLAICECAWNATADPEELARLPSALTLLLELMGHEGSPTQLKDCTRALGSVLTSVAPHVPPGRLQEVDKGVELLLMRLQETPVLKAATKAAPEEPRSPAAPACPLVTAAEIAAEAMGRVALVSSAWRQALRSCGALGALTEWIRCGGAPRRLQKYLLWGAGAIGGLPCVASLLRLHMAVLSTADAALCTIIDILDDDIDGEYALMGVERGADADLSALLSLVVDAMQLHSGAPEVQARGGQCIGLLVPLVAPAAFDGLAPGAIRLVLAASRRFPRRQDVVRGACAALRAICSCAATAGEACNLRGSAVGVVLQEDGAADLVEQLLSDFATGQNACDLLEDACAVLALFRGVEFAVERVAQAAAGSAVRVAGLKALFEVGCTDPRLLAGGVATAVAEACLRIVAEEAEAGDFGAAGGGRLQEVAALLLGLCRGTATLPAAP